jgi:hypothetical protein
MNFCTVLIEGTKIRFAIAMALALDDDLYFPLFWGWEVDCAVVDRL